MHVWYDRMPDFWDPGEKKNVLNPDLSIKLALVRDFRIIDGWMGQWAKVMESMDFTNSSRKL